MRQRKRSDPNRPGWSDQLRMLKAAVETMPPGPTREEACRRAEQLEAAIQMDRWLRAPDSQATR